jgi:hypothetical protein
MRRLRRKRWSGRRIAIGLDDARYTHVDLHTPWPCRHWPLQDMFGKDFRTISFAASASRASLFIGAGSAANGMTACPWLLLSCAVNGAGIETGTVQWL